MDSVHETIFDETTDFIPVGNEHILLVDDESQLLGMQQQMLERLGYKITAKSNGSEALRTFQQTPEAFDLLITDQTMPNLTGAELSAAVFDTRNDLPVILCTGFSEALSAEAAAEIGIRYYLQKPVPFKVLAQTIRLALNDAFEEAAFPFTPQGAVAH
jgi:DNA-binding NtrC family response regulator